MGGTLPESAKMCVSRAFQFFDGSPIWAATGKPWESRYVESLCWLLTLSRRRGLTNLSPASPLACEAIACYSAMAMALGYLLPSSSASTGLARRCAALRSASVWAR